jgi:hypothetical protein
MNNMTEKSANQLYKESKSTLSFKDWIEREKAKGVQIPNIEANAAMMNAIGSEQKTNEKEPDKTKILLRNLAFVAVVVVLSVVVVKTIRAKNNE